jgi:hypothetical protein
LRKWKDEKRKPPPRRKRECATSVCCVIVLFRTHTLFTSHVWSSPLVQCLTDIAWWTGTSRPELLLSWTWPCGNYLFWLWAVVYTHSVFLCKGGDSKGKRGAILSCVGGCIVPTTTLKLLPCSNHTLIIHITVIQFLCVTRAWSCTVALHSCLTQLSLSRFSSSSIFNFPLIRFGFNFGRHLMTSHTMPGSRLKWRSRELPNKLPSGNWRFYLFLAKMVRLWTFVETPERVADVSSILQRQYPINLSSCRYT